MGVSAIAAGESIGYEDETYLKRNQNFSLGNRQQHVATKTYCKLVKASQKRTGGQVLEADGEGCQMGALGKQQTAWVGRGCGKLRGGRWEKAETQCHTRLKSGGRRKESVVVSRETWTSIPKDLGRLYERCPDGRELDRDPVRRSFRS